ncbi:MAG: Ni/Fe hydrogenase subunit alpha [Chloroflexi bacterium]|uniref:Ni/Fe hydrogenase subunit alpha n=1 Tax=Candidatus Flexifilum breve TaxID=3140694 RepID=UPI00313651EE|nr:Ni/Fe hydrogenase subunit alpha [Chloroflexota bacterium]
MKANVAAPTRTLKVNLLARVEGEGALYVKVKGDQVADIKFNIFEPPRLFEGFLRGRAYSEAPDITARICGICPVAYQMSSVHAMERALNVKVDGQLRALRRLLYCGEWIESHVLHVYMLHAPDFLGYPDALTLAKDHPDAVKRGLKLKKIGNEIVRVLGGREIHPINVRVGGFYHVPSKRDFQPLLEQLKWARDAALETAEWVGTLPFPDFTYDYEFVALHHPDEYPLCEGRLVSNKGLNIDIEDYEKYFIEEHVAHSNALHSVLKGRGQYHVGPLARYNLNYDQLTPLAKQAAQAGGLGRICTNPFQTIIVRAVETVYACDHAIELIEQYEPPPRPAVEVTPGAGIGWGCTEAPRGFLYHRYRLDYSGAILDARIVPPTAQNQKVIEDDLRRYVSDHLDTPDEELTLQCEQVIRNYDPCISCATHFLNLTIERT